MPHTLNWTKIWAPVTVSRTTWTHTEFPSRLQSVNMCVKFRNKVCTTSNYLPTTISDHLHPLLPHDLIHLNSVLYIIITYNGHHYHIQWPSNVCVYSKHARLCSVFCTVSDHFNTPHWWEQLNSWIHIRDGKLVSDRKLDCKNSSKYECRNK